MLRRRLLMQSGGIPEVFVDLGLPSGTLWAKGNICKDDNGNYFVGEPTDYGCYFSWGNIVGYNQGEGYNFSSSNYRETPGASLRANIASNDASHDAALACLGAGKNMPTYNQISELYDNCTATWTSNYKGSGIAGRIFKSKKAGYTDSEIFIPMSGEINGLTLQDAGTWSNLWTSSYSGDYPYGMYVDSGTCAIYRSTRYYGRPIRAVQPK